MREQGVVNSSGSDDIEETAALESLGGRPGARPSVGPVHIGRYEVRVLLGRGGMGAVYTGFDPMLERDVALKVMLPQIAGDLEQKQRFEREARAVAKMMHPNVVTIFDFGYHTDGSPYLVMELLRGQDLSALLKSGASLSIERKTSIIRQVLEGLGLAHKAGIVHRDVKPPNIFITDDDTTKIMDFGIARLASAAATGSGAVLGTATYMSPEQVRGEAVDGRSDLFSTGIVLYELLTGCRPFEAATPMATMYRIAHASPSFDLEGKAHVEPFLPVLRKALEKKREDRYQTAAEFAEALRQCLESPARTEREAPTIESRPVARPAPSAPARPAPGPAPAARRSDPSGIFRLLREIYTGGKSGHLHFLVGQTRKSIRILKGQVIHGTSDVEGEHLGDILVRYGLLDQADRERAVAVVLRERRRLGVVLSELGILGRDKVEEAVGLHVREILFSALDAPGVSFSFEEVAESALEADLVCPLSTGEVILEATRRIQDPELVKRILGDTERRLVLSSDPMLRAQRISLTPTDGFVLSRIDGTLSAREVMKLVSLPSEDVERSLFSLLCTGVVGYAPETTGARKRAVDVRTPPPRSFGSSVTPPPFRVGDVRAPLPPRLTPTPPTPTPPQVAPPPPAAEQSRINAADTGEQRKGARGRSVEEIRQLILELHANLKRDHFEILGLGRSATEADVKEAYAGFARVLHPDACQDPRLADLRDERNQVFARLSQAYETLRDPESRARYEKAYEPSKLRTPAPRWAPTPPTPPAAVPITPPPVARPETPSPMATPTPEGPVTPPPRPAVRVPDEPEEPQPLDPRLLPENVLRRAEALFGEGKYWDAIQQLEPVIPRLGPPGAPLRAEAQVLLARAYTKNPRWTKRAALVLQQVTHHDPTHIEAYLLLGEIYAAGGLAARARSTYAKVLEIDPHNRQARKELAALESLEAPS
jgi:serine/threonine protein kinase/tetratricopeptide (TPR) repeat protein